MARKSRTDMLNGTSVDNRVAGKELIKEADELSVQIDRKVNNIRNNATIVKDSFQTIISDLIFLRDHQKQFTKQYNMTLEEFIHNELTMSKQSFYEHIRAYETSIEYKSPELYKRGNLQLLLEINKIQDKDAKKDIKKILKKSDVSLKDVKKVRRTYSGKIIKSYNVDGLKKELKKLFNYYDSKKAMDELTKLVQEIGGNK